MASWAFSGIRVTTQSSMMPPLPFRKAQRALPHAQILHIRREHPLQNFAGVLADKPALRHVTDVKHTALALGTGPLMTLDDAQIRVLHRHSPMGKGHKLGVMLGVKIMEREPDDFLGWRVLLFFMRLWCRRLGGFVACLG